MSSRIETAPITKRMLQIADNPSNDWLKKYNPLLFEKQVVTAPATTVKKLLIHHDIEVQVREYDAQDAFIKHLATKIKDES
jgi:hypothetical protein